MQSEADRFELDMRQRDARKTVLVGTGLLVVAGVLLAIFAVECIVVYVAVHDTESTVRVPVAGFVAPLVAALLFAALGAQNLRDGVRKSRAAAAFETEPTGLADLMAMPR